MTIEIKLGDVVRLRKPHPCGSYEWEVVRVGADISLKCLKCQRKVLLARDVFGRRVENVFAKKDSHLGKENTPPHYALLQREDMVYKSHKGK